MWVSPTAWLYRCRLHLKSSEAGVYYRGELAGILIYRSFYGLINGIHLAEGARASRCRRAVSALFYTNRCPWASLVCAIISARTPLKVLIEKALCTFIVCEQF